VAANPIAEPAMDLPKPRDCRLAWQLEHTFALLLLLFGLCYGAVMPPCQVADESDHFVHAYHVSEGNPCPVMVGTWGGGSFPESILRLTHDFVYLPFHPERQTRSTSFRNLLTADLDPDLRKTVPYISSCYSLVPYLPQAVGMAGARVAGLRPLYIFYAGRLANLLVAVVAVFLAIRVTPVFKLVFGTVALLPITVQQFASNSPDGSTFAAAFLLTALVLRVALNPNPEERDPAVHALFPVLAWLTLCKFPYGALALFFLAVPAARLGGWRRYLLIGAGLALMTLTLALCMIQLKHYVPDCIMPDPEVHASIRKQMRFIQSHPAHYVSVCAATVSSQGKIWIEQLGTLGWLDTPVNPLAFEAFLLLLVLVAICDRRQEVAVTGRIHALALATAGTCTLMIFTANYACGDPLHAPVIHGISGRYFVPFLPLLLLPFYNRTVRVEVPRPLLVNLCVSGCAAIQIVAVVALIRRYYFPLDYEIRFMPIAMLAGAALIVLVTGVALRQHKSLPVQRG
jgi:uncharacterized membrane protein